MHLPELRLVACGSEINARESGLGQVLAYIVFVMEFCRGFKKEKKKKKKRSSWNDGGQSQMIKHTNVTAAKDLKFTRGGFCARPNNERRGHSPV